MREMDTRTRAEPLHGRGFTAFRQSIASAMAASLSARSSYAIFAKRWMTTLKLYRCGITKNYTQKTNTDVAASNNIAPEISMTENCVKRLQEMQSEEKCVLRVAVEGGGCSGFQYMFSLDSEPEKDDYILQDGGVSVVIDSMSLEFLRGATIDYQKELIRSSFRIVQNPKAEKGCSCGSSFAIKI